MISTYVPSLELCKKLRDLGWKKETMFWWFCDDAISKEDDGIDPFLTYGRGCFTDIVLFPAPTVGEMMEAIPFDVEICKLDNKAGHICTALENTDEVTLGFSEKLPDCLARLLIDLLENNLVKLEG